MFILKHWNCHHDDNIIIEQCQILNKISIKPIIKSVNNFQKEEKTMMTTTKTTMMMMKCFPSLVFHHQDVNVNDDDDDKNHHHTVVTCKFYVAKIFFRNKNLNPTKKHYCVSFVKCFFGFDDCYETKTRETF